MCKAALTGLTKAWPVTSARAGPTATVVHASLIGTDVNPADYRGAGFLRPVTAVGSYGGVDDIAEAVAHLADDGGRYITGTAITVNGGFAA
jgi:3-oxoacyl-[acyl-carrier protein] reductase